MIKWIWDPTFGNCFKINYNQEVNNPDMRMRLELLSRIDNAQLSTQPMRGLIIEIAPANENGGGGYPFVFEWTPVEPGTHTDIVIAASTARVMPKPFSSCVDIDLGRNEGESLSPILRFMKKMGLEYSREFCLDVYSQYLINKELSCYDPT